MIVQRLIRLLVACLLVLVFAGLADAGERDYWRHSTGHFTNTKENKWTEKAPDGTHHFVETKRNKHYVELYDESRDITVRLFKTYSDAKSGNGEFERLYEGQWVGK